MIPRALGLAVLLGAFGLLAPANAHLFSDRSGKTLEAELVRIDGANVILKTATGQTLTVPLDRLSDADQAFVRGPAPSAPEPAAVAPAPLTWEYDSKRTAPGLVEARFRFWLPDAQRAVRGMLILVPGSNGDGRGDAGAGDWQSLARELNLGIMACCLKDSGEGSGYCYAGNGSGKILLDALEAFAQEQKHPEVATVPLFLYGHSAGGQFNYNFACWKPERTAAFIVNKGGFYYDTPARPQTRKVPAILFAGENDKAERLTNIRELFKRGRSGGALWALCVEKGVGHDVAGSRAISQEFFRSVTKARLGPPLKPLALADGLLAMPGSPALPANDFKGATREASWLPDQATAEKWAAVQ